MRLNVWLMIIWLMFSAFGCGVAVYSGEGRLEAAEKEIKALRDDIFVFETENDRLRHEKEDIKEQNNALNRENQVLLDEKRDLINEKEKLFEELVKKLNLKGLRIKFNISEGWQIEESVEEAD